MADLVEKASDTEVRVTKEIVQVQPLRLLIQQRATIQFQLDTLNAQVLKLDTLIQQAKALGVVEVKPK